jgi:choline dehydrogenase
MRLGRTHPLSDLIHSELAPGLAADSDVAILASIQSTLDSYYHASSTVPMGPEKDSAAVVNLECRIYGICGLRVVDASIFPDVPSVATNITTITVAEHVAAKFLS